MRSDTFSFMRDSPVNLFRYIPVFLSKDENFKSVQEALNREHEEYRLKVIDIAKQFFIETATWGVEDWEEFAGVTPKANADLEQRRAAVKAKLLGQATMTLDNTNRLINAFTDKGTAYVEETSEGNKVKIVIPEQKVYLEDLRDALDEMLPAHLAYDFQRNIEIDDEEDDGVGDSVVDINDESTADTDGGAFFIHADLPTFENVPYGSWYSAPKYNGSARAAPIGFFQYDGAQKYSEFEISAVQYGKPCKWWFTATGENSHNKEFKHDGAVKYDGLKPQDIRYDDDIDELATVEVKKILEDDIEIKSLRYDGIIHYDGKIETDSGGELSLIRFKKFNGAIQYDGGDLNLFDGTIKANGKFNFEGGGSRARIKILSDGISGKIDNARTEKEKQLDGNFYQEIVEYIPLVADKNLNLISLSKISDTVAETTENYPVSEISKAVRYNGVKNYNGGDLNLFDGTIKNDGKFNFEGGGNRAKVEQIAVDLDGKFSTNRNIKNAPANYEEHFDFIPSVEEKTRMTMKIAAFEDFLNPKDKNGNLIISRRSRFNGNLNYGGYFETKIRRYNGGLKCDGNYRAEIDGSSKFDGSERYGGRANSNFVEYVTDLDGKEMIVDFEKIPIATRDKLGFVIIGKNIEIDDSGKISSSRPNLISMSKNKLKNIFEEWRLRQ